VFVKFASIIVAVHQSMIIPLESSGPIVAPVKSALDKFTKNLESTVQNPVVGSRQIGQESNNPTISVFLKSHPSQLLVFINFFKFESSVGDGVGL